MTTAFFNRPISESTLVAIEPENVHERTHSYRAHTRTVRKQRCRTSSSDGPPQRRTTALNSRPMSASQEIVAFVFFTSVRCFRSRASTDALAATFCSPRKADLWLASEFHERSLNARRLRPSLRRCLATWQPPRHSDAPPSPKYRVVRDHPTTQSSTGRARFESVRLHLLLTPRCRARSTAHRVPEDAGYRRVVR